jgi:hypothetical protein
MSIILARDGSPARRIDRTVIERESDLQKYLLERPDTIPLDEFKPNIELLVLAREFPTPSGPIDLLAADADGDVYIIETKLYKNLDKRIVLAQALDYGAAMWRAYGGSGAFISRLDGLFANRDEKSLAERVEARYGLTGSEYTDFIERLSQSVTDGRIRFVILMDRLDERLKDLIAFVNVNSKFAVLGVGLDFYEDGDLKVLIPTLHGAEAAKQPQRSEGAKPFSDAASFLVGVETHLSPEDAIVVRQLYEWVAARTKKIRFGRGSERGSITPLFSGVPLFNLYSDGTLAFYFKGLKSPAQLEWGKRLANELQALTVLELSDNFLNSWPHVSLPKWRRHSSEILEVFEKLLPIPSGNAR